MMDRFQIKDKRRIATVGTWNGHNITETMLKEAVKYSDSKIPITRGHVDYSSGDISNGNLQNLTYSDGQLFAERTLYDDLAKDWQSEKFINESIEMQKHNGKWRVSAMAELGAVAPGMKGLAFSESTKGIFYCEEIIKDNETILRFTEKLNNEVIMPDVNGYEKGYEAGRKAEKDSLTLQFSESNKKEVKEAIDKVTLTFSEEIKVKDSKIEELEKKVIDTEELQFSAKIDEVIATVPEKDQEAVKLELMEFRELSFDKFKKVADKYKVAEIKVPETRQFSETNETQEPLNEYNYQDERK